MQLYKLFLIFLLFTYISSTCTDGTGSSVDECSKRELSDQEKGATGVACCLISQIVDGNEEKACFHANKVTYDEILKGKKEFTISGSTLVYNCKTEDNTKTTEAGKSSSASNNLALSLLILIFLGL